ncbi:MAG TPA: glycoside hydrolase family 2 TIM barrel-domain containing protein [Terriglobia bacterium]|nr:glycoside hydrolase family 2 TIM barrel-domain containing protein [Terriglobia bacterium]
MNHSNSSTHGIFFRIFVAFSLLLSFTRALRGQGAAFNASHFRGSIILNGNQWQSVGNNPPQSSFGFSDWTQMVTNPLIPSTGWTSGRVPTLPITDGVTTSVWYQTPFFLPASAEVSGRRWFIDIGEIGHYAGIYINGAYAGENYGQYVPIEVEVTGLLNFNSSNTLQIYVHNADANYARPGGITEPDCSASVRNCGGNSYRPGTEVTSARNWVGITGDIELVWRPSTYATVYTFASWRNQTVSALVSANGSEAVGASAMVINSSGKKVLTLPYEPLSGGSVTLTANWPSSSPWWNIGHPTLYWMKVSLLNSSRQTVDVAGVRFGPREAYVESGTYYINGQVPFLVGDFWKKADQNNIDMPNRPDELAFYFGQILENSGVNTVVSHWNPYSETALALADELGFAVIEEMYCDGATAGQDVVDSVSGWQSWMEGQAQSRMLALQNHPSVVMMRPIDVSPDGIPRITFLAAVKSAAEALDPQQLPWGDGSDIAWYGTGFDDPVSDYNPTWISEPPQNSMPQFIKEIHGQVNGSGALPQWALWWTAVLTSGGVGMVPTEVTMWTTSTWTPSWNFGGSGSGVQIASGSGAPNFQTRVWTPSVVSSAWQAYGFGFNGETVPVQGSYFASGMSQTPNSAAFLLFPGGDPVGVLADSAGANFNPLLTGTATLDWGNSAGDQRSTVTVTALP